MKSLLKLLALCAALLALWGCNDKVGETPGSYDPCSMYEDIEGRIAEFEINRTINGLYTSKVIEEPDSVLFDRFFSISAMRQAEKYVWKIGDLVFVKNEKKLSEEASDYPEFPFGNTKIKLTASTDSLGECYPGGYSDSLSKEVYIYPPGSVEKEKQKYSGRYAYQNISQPSDKGVFEIKDSLAPPGYHTKDFYVTGFLHGCPLFHYAWVHHNYVQFFTEVNDNCRGDGFINFSGNGPRYTMEFYPADFTGNPEQPFEVQERRMYTIKKLN